ncbi:TRAP transporter substrate-binding protein [Marinobacter psychrophilus]|jgi:tripartite ATP-independent transporter DctP family solute receptor|uniref:TRAP transporter substrate-binding protein n=1 Tax=Marinobacter psychrophilus TaxID=330734 RepID=UPI000A9DA04F|nr:TRAP transporter substrate-binding protein [Marinobacter psychrophilus]
MKISLFHKLTIVQIAIAISISFAATVKADVTTIQVNHEMGVGTPTARALEWFGNAVTEETDGAVKFRYFHTHELGSERETYDMLQSGAIQMGVSGAQIISVLAPEYGALLLPYVFADADHVTKVLNGKIGKEMHQQFLDQKGIRILGWAHRAPRHLTTSEKKVQSPADMKDLRIRIREIPVQIDAFRALGARPVPMAFPEVYTALQTGTIDAQENPASIMVANNFQEVQDNVTLTAHIREAFWWEISDRVWQNLSPEIQAAFDNNIDEAISLANQWEFEADGKYLAEFEAAGVNIIELDKETLNEFSSLVESVATEYADKWKEGVYEEIVRLR